MKERLTARWMRNFINACRMSSFRDKAAALRAEPNPYYVLEWLLFPDEEEDRFWDAWENERTPGAESGAMTDLRTCFAEQLPYTLLLAETKSEAEDAKLALALEDLAACYGETRLKEGAAALTARLEDAASRYAAFEKELRREEHSLENRTKRQLKELETEALKDNGIDLEAERRVILAKAQRERQQLPGRVLKRMHPGDSLLITLAFASGAARPAERARGAAERLKAALAHPAGEWERRLLEEGKMPPPGPGTSAWIAAWMSHSEMARGLPQTEARQRAALRGIAAAVKADDPAQQDWLAAAFQAENWEERLAEPEFADGALHAFVWFALFDETRRKRLREKLVLRHWETFSKRLDAGASFETSSWVLLLDPENVQQRLLRGAEEEAAARIRKLCEWFAEAIRRGLAPRIVAPLYDYLARHDPETFYSFVYGAKTLEEAATILELGPETLSRLFRGSGIRQTASRKHLLELFLSYLDDGNDHCSVSHDALRKLADVLADSKREAVVGWLKRNERTWRKRIGSKKGRMFTKLLRFRWIGTAEKAGEQHRAVKDWLNRRCDWVQFETDAVGAAEGGIRYAIVKPGAIDADTGEVLARAVVRTEFNDPKRIAGLLDDLRRL